MKGIFVSHLDEFQLSENLWVNNSKVIVYRLIEDQVVDDTVDLLSYCSDLIDTVDIDVLKKLVNFLNCWHLLDDVS